MYIYCLVYKKMNVHYLIVAKDICYVVLLMVMHFCLSWVPHTSCSKEDISDVDLFILYPVYLIQLQTLWIIHLHVFTLGWRAAQNLGLFGLKMRRLIWTAVLFQFSCSVLVVCMLSKERESRSIGQCHCFWVNVVCVWTCWLDGQWVQSEEGKRLCPADMRPQELITHTPCSKSHVLDFILVMAVYFLKYVILIL